MALLLPLASYVILSQELVIRSCERCTLEFVDCNHRLQDIILTGRLSRTSFHIRPSIFPPLKVLAINGEQQRLWSQSSHPSAQAA